jgi:hypothetical protein
MLVTCLHFAIYGIKKYPSSELVLVTLEKFRHIIDSRMIRQSTHLQRDLY